MIPPPPPPVWGGGGTKKKADEDIGDGTKEEKAAKRQSTANPLLAHQQILDHLGPAALRAAQLSGHAPLCSPSGTHLGAFTNGRYHHAFDPDAPSFTIETHVDPCTNRYKCPWTGCGRDFPTAAGLLGHLRAPAHNQRYSCPFCGRSFAGGAALGGHLEQEGYTCGGVQDHRVKNAMGKAGEVGGAGDNGESREEKRRSTWMGRKR
jgi:hypothetical protein